MQIQNAALVLADISGYTRFVKLHAASLLHAEQIITELMEAVIDTAHDPLMLNKLEGDAAFLYARIDTAGKAAAKEITQQVYGFFAAFRLKQQALITAVNGGCPCDACRQIEKLRLKAVVHCGPVVIKRIRQFEELAGESVIVAHRLLKNPLTSDEYILMTNRFCQLSDALPSQALERHIEVYEDLGDVEFTVYYPETESLDILVSKPMTRWAGVVEGGRLFRKSLWHRFFGPRRDITHLPIG